MSSANPFRSNLRDLRFNLFEFLEIGRTSLGHAPFDGMSAEAAWDALGAFEKLCAGEIGASFAEADRHPPTLDSEGNVHLPEGLRQSLAAYNDAGWHRLALPERLGGFGAPPSVGWATFELLASANAALGFYIFGPFLARTIDRVGTESQKKRFIESTIERCWGGSMVLTEPDAGSDVGAGRTKARHVGDGIWELEGVKRFITNGDFDAAENIIHLVLARPEGAAVGTKGLSMFIVPKIWVNEDGTLGERNGVRCTGLEKKMGIKGSVTCELTFGDGVPARGLLVGDVHDGIRQMFHVIEQARMAVGIKSIAELSSAYAHALEYTKERVQGADLLDAANKHAPRVRIIQHPDVRRMLMTQKSYEEGMRALALFTAHIQDQVEILGGHGAKEARELDKLNDLLLPLVKGYCSEKTWELLALSLQCFGGSGYCQDYPIEQYIRDQKIDSLYEGTTHIQALDLILRKVAKDGGETLRGLLGRVRETIETEEGGPSLAAERAALAEALAQVEGTFMALLERIGDSLYHVGFQGNRVLFALAELVLGWLLVRHAALATAKRAQATGEDGPFYDGKIASARFFCHEVLPSLAMTRQYVERSRLDLMDVAEEAF